MRKNGEIRSKIFLSWRGKTAKALASRYESALKSLNLNNKDHYFFSPNLPKGGQWRQDLYSEIRKSKVVVAFLTAENIKDARWIECECAAIYLSDPEALIYPCLIDLSPIELPTDSAWKSALQGVSFVSPEFNDIVDMLKESLKACSIPIDENKIVEVTNKLLTEWQNIIAASPSREAGHLAPAVRSQVIDSFKDDLQFEDWAFNLHCVPHYTRDLAVHLLDRWSHLADPKADLNSRLSKLGEGRPLAEMDDWKVEIQTLLNYVEEVFERIVQPEAKVWACLRDLRKGGYYYNFSRSIGGGIRDDVSIPWKSECTAIKALISTLTKPCEDPVGRNCTIITPDEGPNPPHRQGYKDPKRQQSMLGAVLLKKVDDRRDSPAQSQLWWILCVNSNMPNTFSAVHKRVLQTCNDAFSVLANTMLRTADPRSNSLGSSSRPVRKK